VENVAWSSFGQVAFRQRLELVLLGSADTVLTLALKMA
jgi:hypothetical protein